MLTKYMVKIDKNRRIILYVLSMDLYLNEIYTILTIKT